VHIFFYSVAVYDRFFDLPDLRSQLISARYALWWYLFRLAIAQVKDKTLNIDKYLA